MLHETVEVSSWEAPFPDPATLAEYEKTIKGGAERIFALTENEQRHRHAMEDADRGYREKGLERAQRIDREGRWLGAVVMLIAIGGAIYCATIGATAIGIALVSVSVMGAIGYLATGKERSRIKGN